MMFGVEGRSCHMRAIEPCRCRRRSSSGYR
jgi:hypothetical protein